MKNLSPETAKPEHITAKRLAIIAMVAAAYFALTVLITPLSYGMVQFRFSEILVLLCFYKKDYCYSMAVGCLLANLFSPMAALDVPFGTLATIIAVIGVYKCKNIWLASIFPVVANGLIVGTELFIAFKEPSLLIQMGFVALGELVVVTIIGVPFFKLLEKNKQVMRLIKQDD